MPLQLVFTSAPQGLSAGRSGYCTVARHRAIPDRLTQLLESIATPHDHPDGATFTFREMEASGLNWYVLSRFVAFGLDYTQRDNRLAHHLIFTAQEAAVLPPPAAIASRWKGWRQEWTGAPTWLEGEDKPLALENQTPLTPATTWREITGTGAKAAWLVNQQNPAQVSLLNTPELPHLLRLLAESSALLGKAAWVATFTTDASKTGSDGFAWAVGASTDRPTIDFATAKSLPAPSGDQARQAATGTSAARAFPGPPPRVTNGAPAPSSAKSNGSLRPTLIILATLLATAVVLIALFSSQRSTPPVVKAAPAPAPVVIDTAKAEEILRNNRAQRDVQSYLESDDLMAAGKLWLDTTSQSPAFAQNYREQILPRLLGRFTASVLAQLNEKLDRPAITTNVRLAQEVLAEASEALRIGAELKVAQDDSWKKLTTLPARAKLMMSIDVRTVILIRGEWQSSQAGIQVPSSADFTLSADGADRIRKLIDTSGATTRDSATARIRLLKFTTFHQRDDQTKYLTAEIRRNQRTSWIESTPEPGREPAIIISISEKAGRVSLSFPPGQATETPNRVIEIALANGERQCLACLGDPASVQPLNLGAPALRHDNDTGIVRAAPWAEAAFNSFIWASGSVGLYPSGHEFPDRDLPSIRATRSLLETDIIRLESKQGPGTPPYEEIAGRRKAFQTGDSIRAGAPWILQAIDARGNAGPRLLEFR